MHIFLAKKGLETPKITGDIHRACRKVLPCHGKLGAACLSMGLVALCRCFQERRAQWIL